MFQAFEAETCIVLILFEVGAQNWSTFPSKYTRSAKPPSMFRVIRNSPPDPPDAAKAMPIHAKQALGLPRQGSGPWYFAQTRSIIGDL